jgi:hypothetical protein
MDSVGWLFVFMNAFQKKSVIATHGELTPASRSLAMAADARDGLTVEETAAIRAFFELLATWEHEERRNERGNKSESRPS